MTIKDTYLKTLIEIAIIMSWYGYTIMVIYTQWYIYLKKRYYNHMHTIRNPTKRTATALSAYIWELKDSSTPYGLTWSILASAQPYLGDQRECGLCNEEAIKILFADYQLLNKRSEFPACKNPVLSPQNIGPLEFHNHWRWPARRMEKVYNSGDPKESKQ